MNKKATYTVAIVEAVGVVGRELIELLGERSFPVGDLVLLGTGDAEGERIEFAGRSVAVRKVTADVFATVDLAIFAGEQETSRAFAPAARAAGAKVIDLSGAFSDDPAVPLVVPEVNAQALEGRAGIIASPRSAVIGLAMVLHPLLEKAPVKRIVLTTFEPVSATGKQAMDELAGQTVALLNFRDVETRVYPHQIAFNCIPQVGAVLESGDTDDERDLGRELRKVLGIESLAVAATAVRVPVFRGLAASVNVETGTAIAANEARALLAGAAGVQVYDDGRKALYPLALDMVGQDQVSVGRIREDASVAAGLSFWYALDNLRKGTALNAVQIAEHLIQ